MEWLSQEFIRQHIIILVISIYAFFVTICLAWLRCKLRRKETKEMIHANYKQVNSNEPIPSTEPSSHQAYSERIINSAYDYYYKKYLDLKKSINAKNYEDITFQIVELLIEMGIWTKDFLPLYHKDFNISDAQQFNVESICDCKDELGKKTQVYKKPTDNPFETPLLVIGIINHLKAMNIKKINLSINGYKYE